MMKELKINFQYMFFLTEKVELQVPNLSQEHEDEYIYEQCLKAKSLLGPHDAPDQVSTPLSKNEVIHVIYHVIPIM